MFWLQMIVMVIFVLSLFCNAQLASERKERGPYTAYSVVSVVIHFILFWLCGAFSTFFPSPLAP